MHPPTTPASTFHPPNRCSLSLFLFLPFIFYYYYLPSLVLTTFLSFDYLFISKGSPLSKQVFAMEGSSSILREFSSCEPSCTQGDSDCLKYFSFFSPFFFFHSLLSYIITLKHPQP
ncbi:MAG: hypothetical protein J3R72DRAFT_244629 [Linnemannia gamsii]|nr:MAG: hypothetical protein J3R72DRAFT_244629 [Linnemannia gamsii]